MDLLRESNPELYDRISTRTDPLFLRLLGPEPEFHRLVFTERIGDLHLVREMRDFRNEYEIKNRRELIEFLVNQILESRSKKIRKACCVFLLMVSFVKNLWWCEMQDHEAFDALKQHRLIADAFEWVRMDENLGDRILPYYCVTRKQDFDVIYGSLSEYYDFDAQKRLPGFDEQLGIELGMSYIGSDFGKQTVNRLSFHLTFETPRDNADVFAEVAAYYSEEEHLQLRKLYIDKTVWAQNVNEFFQQVFDDYGISIPILCTCYAREIPAYGTVIDKVLEDPSFENVLLHEMETLKQLCRESSVLNNMDILLLLTSRKISRWFLHVLIIVFDLEHCPGATVDFYNWVDEMGRRIFGCVHEYLLENQAELQLDPYELETVRMLTTAEAEFPGLRSDEPAEDFNPEMEEDED